METLHNVADANVTLKDFKHACRVCMTRDTNNMDIFDGGNSVADKIEYCTGLQILKNDGFPLHICNTCYHDLQTAHKFKTVCITTNDELKKLLLKELIKKEVEESNSDKISGQDEYCDDNDIKDEIFDMDFDADVQVIPKRDDKERMGGLKKVKLKLKKANGTKLSKRKKSLSDEGGCIRKKFKFRRLFCETCNIKFSSKTESDEHKKSLHKDSNWICEVCGKVFAHRASHYTHQKTHLPPRFSCADCDYRSWNKYDLVKHVRIHIGVKPYSCTWCTASYHCSSNLKSHIKRNHGGIKRFSCTVCHHQFYDKSKLQRHLDSHNDIKRYECEVCHSLFSRRCTWKKHLLRNHGIDIPSQRPGRQSTNYMKDEMLLDENR